MVLKPSFLAPSKICRLLCEQTVAIAIFSKSYPPKILSISFFSAIMHLYSAEDIYFTGLMNLVGDFLDSIKYAFHLAVGISILILLLGNGAGAAAIISVPDDYARIQWAIENATDGNTIEVQSGTYYENLSVNKKLTLRGIGMPVVDSLGRTSTITLLVDEIRLEGFTATGSGSYPEAGIRITSSNNTLIGNNASNNLNNGFNLIFPSITR